MRLSKFIKFMLLVTVLSLIYIHMQMQIFDLAYKGKRKEKKIINLSENNNMLTYNILQLKSACHLGLNLLEENSGLQFSDNNSIVHLMTPEAMSAEEEILAASISPKKTNPILSFLSSRAREARAAEQKETVKPWRRTR